MNFTKRTDYALKALIEIGQSKNNQPITRETIAKNQKISAQFLEQMLISMQKSGIIKSVRGPGGGFILLKPVQDINVWQVFQSVESSTSIQSLRKPSKKTEKIQSVWNEIDKGFRKILSEITLERIITQNQTSKSLFDQFDPIKDEMFSVMDDNGKIINSKYLNGISDDDLLKAYKFMIYVRTADEMCISYQRQGRLFTFPPNLGQEAIATAVGYTLGEDDWLVPAYREVAAWLLKGGSLKDIFLLWGGNEIGATFSNAPNLLPISVPIASQLLHAVGIGFGLKYKEKKGTVFTFVGDGGTSEGDFHEALNFAAVWQVPVIFIIQNNQYAISVPVQQQTASTNLAIKSIGYGMPGIKVDGNDYLALQKVLQDAKEYTESGKGPILIEALTYRKGAHTTSDDPTLYRTIEEEKTWSEKDPIARLRSYLIKQKKWNTQKDKPLIENYKKEIDAEFLEYEKSPEYKLEDVFKYMYKYTPDILNKQKIEYDKFLNWKRDLK